MNRQPLDAEERELAARLAQLSAAGGPSPALDARILAAARAEAASPTTRATHAHRRPRAKRRWPVAAGAVATLALAVGLAWQLRPTPDSDAASDPFYSVSEAPAAAASSGPSADAAEAMPVPDMAPPAAAAAASERQNEIAQEAAKPQASAVAAPAPEAPADAAAAGASAAAARDAQAFPETARGESRARIQSAPLEDEPPIVFDDLSPVRSAPAPAAPPPPPAPAPQQSGAARAASAGSAREAKAAGERTELDRIEVTGARIGREQAENEAFDASINDEPPATADSPEVQRAWLQRIRELVANGDPAAARASLAEFRRRYPQYVLPDDLRGLAP